LIKFFNSSIGWKKDMKFKEFMANVKKSVKFINGLVKNVSSDAGFKPESHLSEKSLIAIGKLYKNSMDLKGDIDLDKVSKAVIDLDLPGAIRSELAYESFVSYMKK
jgi:hypothetical protein